MEEILKGRAYDADKTSGQRGLGFHRSISSAVQAIENTDIRRFYILQIPVCDSFLQNWSA